MAKLNITQLKSRIGATQNQKKNLDALGLRKINQTVQHENSAIILGMIEKVKHLIKVEEVK
ncbi:MAG: 50S ribosomal protein L30 [Rikenellaceae bacterium]|nr:50S ribosomal protein L30 [Rikenellaceae bacterium]